MYAGRVAYCPLVNHGEHVGGTDRQKDGLWTITLCSSLDAASVKTCQEFSTKCCQGQGSRCNTVRKTVSKSGPAVENERSVTVTRRVTDERPEDWRTITGNNFSPERRQRTEGG